MRDWAAWGMSLSTDAYADADANANAETDIVAERMCDATAAGS